MFEFPTVSSLMFLTCVGIVQLWLPLSYGPISVPGMVSGRQRAAQMSGHFMGQ